MLPKGIRRRARNKGLPVSLFLAFAFLLSLFLRHFSPLFFFYVFIPQKSSKALQ